MKTLGQFRSSPVLSPLDLRSVPVSAVMARYGDAMAYLSHNGGLMAYPESDAVSFYLGNSAYAMVMQLKAESDPLNEYEPLLAQYLHTVRVTSTRLFFYLLLICTRESRHIHQNTDFFSELDGKYGCMKFTKALRPLGSDGSANRLIKSPPDFPLGVYTDHLVELFNRGAEKHLFSGGYGGKAWGTVATVLRNFVHGVTSAELMLDAGFALSHNNGPIFNKNMLYHHYDKTELVRVLDVQRAGMIPQYVGEGTGARITVDHRAYYKQMLQVFGPVVMGGVDWHRVEALGSVQKYGAEKKMMAVKKKVGAAEVFITPQLKPLKITKSRNAA